jgi:DNA-binding NarL/FixJ family response regulator
MKKPFSIVIAENHTILRDGLKSLLASHPDLKVVGEAGQKNWYRHPLGCSGHVLQPARHSVEVIILTVNTR